MSFKFLVPKAFVVVQVKSVTRPPTATRQQLLQCGTVAVDRVLCQRPLERPHIALPTVYLCAIPVPTRFPFGSQSMSERLWNIQLRLRLRAASLVTGCSISLYGCRTDSANQAPLPRQNWTLSGGLYEHSRVAFPRSLEPRRNHARALTVVRRTCSRRCVCSRQCVKCPTNLNMNSI